MNLAYHVVKPLDKHASKSLISSENRIPYKSIHDIWMNMQYMENAMIDIVIRSFISIQLHKMCLHFPHLAQTKWNTHALETNKWFIKGAVSSECGISIEPEKIRLLWHLKWMRNANHTCTFIIRNVMNCKIVHNFCVQRWKGIAKIKRTINQWVMSCCWNDRQMPNNYELNNI